ncbi:MAG: MFS transporter [Pseudomonadota bacterium]
MSSTSSTNAARLTGPLKLALFSGLVLFAMGQSVLFAIFGPVAREIGLADWQAGAVISLSALVVTICSPLWGRYSDRVGRRGPFLVGIAGFGVMTLVFTGLLASLPGLALPASASFALLLLARVAYAVPVAAGQPAAAGAIADASDPETRAAALALLGAAFGAGTILGPAFAATLAGIGPLVPLFLIALAAIPAAVFAARHIPATPPAAETPPGLGSTGRRVALLLVGVASAFFTVAAVQQSLAFYVQDIFGLDAPATAQRTGLFFMVLALANLAAILTVSRVNPPTRPTLALGGALGAAGAALLVAVPSAPWLLWPAMVIMGLGFGAFMPAAQGEASLRVPADVQGAVGGLVASAMAAGFIIGPIGGTALYGVDPALAYGVAAAAVVIGTALTLYRPPA